MNKSFDELPNAVERLTKMVTAIQDSLTLFFKQQKSQPPQEDLIGIEQACKVLGLAKPTVYAMTQSKKIPFYQPGRKLMFKRSELVEWMEQSRRESASQTHESILATMQSGIRRKPSNAYKL